MSAAVTVRCPNKACGFEFTVPADKAATATHCPNCIQPLTKPKAQLRGGMVRAGELPALKKAIRENAPTKARLQFVAAAAAIAEQPDPTEAAFMARQLVQCTLPHSEPSKDLPIWKRENGVFTLSVIPALDRKTGKSIGYPYGTIPRLLLFWMTTEAVRTRSRRLKLGKNLADFMRDVGLNPDTGGGKRSDAKRLTEQAKRLFRAIISFDAVLDEGEAHGEAWLDMQVAPSGELWWNPKTPEQSVLWDSWIELGDKFFNAIMAYPVPFDIRALKALKRSPLALDLYAWVCYRAYTIIAKGLEPQFISWARLMQQFGGNYTKVEDFKKEARAALRKVQAVYTGLSIKPAHGGFTIHATRLAVPKRLPSGKGGKP